MAKKKKKLFNVEIQSEDSNVIIINPNRIKVRGVMPQPQIKHTSQKSYNRKAKHKKPYRQFLSAA